MYTDYASGSLHLKTEYEELSNSILAYHQKKTGQSIKDIKSYYVNISSKERLSL